MNVNLNPTSIDPANEGRRAVLPDAAVTDGSGSGRIEMANVAIAFADKTRRSTDVVTDIDLVIEPGQFAALIGPSGCGKSTLLNAAAGFVRASRGTVCVDGRAVTKPTASVGIVFQNFALFPWFSALGNIEFPLKQLSLSRAERRERATAALTEVGLGAHLRKYPGQLSGGMKQRVAIARTLVLSPKVLLMDEPFGALDAQTRLSMQALLLSLWERRRSTVLFVTHDVDEALILADLVYVMSTAPGRIIQRIDVDTPRPRAVDRLDQAFLDRRAHIIGLLRQQHVTDIS